MNSIIEQSVAWARGEIFEATLTGIAGIAVLVLCAIAWRFGTGEAAAGLRLPLLVAGLIFLGGGVSMFRQNNELIPQMQAAHEADASAFVEAEIRRVQSFDAIYLPEPSSRAVGNGPHSRRSSTAFGSQVSGGRQRAPQDSRCGGHPGRTSGR